MKKFVILLVLLCSLALFCGNGIADEEVSSTNTGYTLQDSVFVSYDGGYDKHTNCYAFALGRRFGDLAEKQTSYPYPDSEIKVGEYGEIGYYSDCFGDDLIPNYSSNNYQALKTAVSADLDSLGYTNVAYYTTCPDVTSLQPNQKLICVRLSSTNHNNYHFMYYDADFEVVDLNGNVIQTGAWLHKPGEGSGILQYIKDINSVWTNEQQTSTNCNAPTEIYDSDIIYFTFSTCYDYDEGRYEISTYNDLLQIYKRTDNIWVLSNSIYIPNNANWETIDHFAGIIDGQNYTIYGMTISNRLSQQSNIGFIGYNAGSITRLRFSDAEINISESVNTNTGFETVNIGIIVAENGGTIEDCQVGESRIYGEGNIMSNIPANIGGICGKNKQNKTIKDCTVKYFNALGYGTIGGVVGHNRGGSITNCDVISPTLNLYHGMVGGVVGFSNLIINGEYSLGYMTNCDVGGGTITFYNGYPDVFPEYYFDYYPDDYGTVNQYGFIVMAGGIAGCHDFTYGSSKRIKGCTVVNTSFYCNISAEIDNTYFPAPEVGVICGRAKSNALNYSTTATVVENTMLNYYSGCSVNVGALPTINQTYIGLRAIGNSNW